MLSEDEIDWLRRVRSAMGHSPERAEDHVAALLMLSEHSHVLSEIVEEHRLWATIRRRLAAAVRFAASIGAAIATALALADFWRPR